MCYCQICLSTATFMLCTKYVLYYRLFQTGRNRSGTQKDHTNTQEYSISISGVWGIGWMSSLMTVCQAQMEIWSIAIPMWRMNSGVHCSRRLMPSKNLIYLSNYENGRSPDELINYYHGKVQHEEGCLVYIHKA